MKSLLRRLVVLQEGEAPALAASFLTLLCMFSSYTILRPIRETMGITSGVEKLPSLFAAVFVVMLLLQPVYGWLTARFPRTVFLPWVYGFFAANLIGFYFWFRLEADHTWIARTYFVWVSVFNLFVVAAFWSLMADVFTREQAGRLFGFIWAAASIGGLIGPTIVRLLVARIGTINLLPVSAVLLLASLGCMFWVIHWQRRQRHHPHPGKSHEDEALGGGMFAAFEQTVRSRYLLGIALFVLLMTWVTTFLYLQQQGLVAKVFSGADERTHFFASIDQWVQGVSLFIQLLLFGRLFKWVGMRVLLAAVPLLMTAGYALYALVPTFMVLVVVYATRRVLDYAVTRPCRDTLFTVVSREEKYKAKSFIDTFVYRGGDTTCGWLYNLLTGPLGFGHAAIGWAGAVTSAVWTLLALSLGKAQAAADAHHARRALRHEGV
jgi:ATP:ADP antiporter, AAA family